MLNSRWVVSAAHCVHFCLEKAKWEEEGAGRRRRRKTATYGAIFPVEGRVTKAFEVKIAKSRKKKLTEIARFAINRKVSSLWQMQYVFFWI